MEEPSPGHTFWERLGRGVAQGWEKAKEASGRLGELAGLRIDLKNARDRLEDRYRHLGRMAAERFLDRGDPGLDAGEGPVAAVIEEIRAARAALRDLDMRLAGWQEQPAEGGGSPPAPPHNPPTPPPPQGEEPGRPAER
jgi:hypothetical protein